MGQLNSNSKHRKLQKLFRIYYVGWGLTWLKLKDGLVDEYNLMIGYWGKHLPPEKFQNLRYFQKLNHFPMSFEIGRKDKMYSNWEKMKSLLPRDSRHEVNYCPETFILPRDRTIAKRQFGNHPLW